MHRSFVKLYRSALILFSLFSLLSTVIAAAPPKDRKVTDKRFENIADNSWSDLTFSAQQPGTYYIEMTDIKGKWGGWGCKNNKYPDGTMWIDGKSEANSDLRLRYRVNGDWVELIKIKQLGVINDDWFPHDSFDKQKTLGQTFVAKEVFDAAGLHTPTWNTKDSQGTLTLYTKSAVTAVKAKGKLAAAWAKLKLSH